MKCGERVWVMLGRERRLVRGVLEAATFAGDCGIVRVGAGKNERRVERSLKRVYPDTTAIRDLARRQASRALRRERHA